MSVSSTAPISRFCHRLPRTGFILTTALIGATSLFMIADPLTREGAWRLSVETASLLALVIVALVCSWLRAVRCVRGIEVDRERREVRLCALTAWGMPVRRAIAFDDILGAEPTVMPNPTAVGSRVSSTLVLLDRQRIALLPMEAQHDSHLAVVAEIQMAMRVRYAQLAASSRQRVGIRPRLMLEEWR